MVLSMIVSRDIYWLHFQVIFNFLISFQYNIEVLVVVSFD